MLFETVFARKHVSKVVRVADTVVSNRYCFACRMECGSHCSTYAPAYPTGLLLHARIIFCCLRWLPTSTHWRKETDSTYDATPTGMIHCGARWGLSFYFVFKMAMCHYPCPDEIDVFRGPHLRMKQLVYEAFEKVSSSMNSFWEFFS